MILYASTVFAQSSQYAFNSSNVNIPDAGAWVSSTITISGAPSGATITGIDVYFKCVHPYSGDLNIDLNADPTGSLGNYNLWSREGGTDDNPSRTVTGISTFNGLSANRTWYLYARDESASDAGYIDEWSIRVYYNSTVIPATPILSSAGTSSSPGPVISDTTPTLQWNSVAGATSYDFGVRDLTASGQPLVVDIDDYTSTSYTTASLTQGHQYRWNVQACNSVGCSGYSDPYYFQTANVCDFDQDNDVDGSDLSEFVFQFQNGTNQISLENFASQFGTFQEPKNITTFLTVPYLDQLDIPIIGEAACASASSAMILAYHGKIGSSQLEMISAAENVFDATSNVDQGLLGRYFLEQHLEQEWNFSSVNFDNSYWNTLYEKIKNEINNERPLILGSRSMTSYGHYIVVIGYEGDNYETGKLIVNDPYGHWNGSIDDYSTSESGAGLLYDFTDITSDATDGVFVIIP
jgi:subtilisin-like proprotein convertase family protein/uncharacterized protein YvpB